MVSIPPGDDAVARWEQAVRQLEEQTAYVIPAVLAFHPGPSYRTIRRYVVTHHHVLGVLYVPGGTLPGYPDSMYIVVVEPRQDTPPPQSIPIIHTSDNTHLSVLLDDLAHWNWNFSFYCYHHGPE